MTVHGTARWTEREELHAQGYLPEQSRAPAGQLLVGFWNDWTAIRYGGDLHQLIVGGTGGGKFTTALAPMLLSGMERATIVAVDPKGEMAKLAGPYFQPAFAAKPSVFLLDPWDVCEAGSTHALNVLDEIRADNPSNVDDARALADAIIIPSGAENTHWDNAARNFLTSIILYVALDPAEAGKRDLVRVREIVTLPWQMPKAYVGSKQPTLLELLVNNLQSTVAGGAIKRGFSSLLNREEKERSGILSSVERDTAWIDSPQMEKVLKSDPRLELKAVGGGQNKYFIVLPPEYFMTHRAWLRLMVTAFAKAMKRYQPSSQAAWPAWRHIIIDEFANLGEMSFILNEVAIARGYGVKYHFAVQDLSQLKRVYKDGWESFINNSFQRFFAIGDLFTADYVSRMLGSATVESVSTSEGKSKNWGVNTSQGTNFSKGHNAGSATAPFTHSYGEGRSDSVAYSDSVASTNSQSVSQVQRALKTPDEVRRLHEGMQIVFFRGLHPVLCLRLPYWIVFPSLPPFTLKEVLGTIGKSRNPATLVYFTKWRLTAGLRLPKRQRSRWRLPTWNFSRWRLPTWNFRGWPVIRIGSGLAVAVVLALLVVRSEPWTSQSRAVAEQPPSASKAVASAPPQPGLPAPVRTRLPVPDDGAAKSLAAGAESRDFLINLMRENRNLCSPGQDDAEHALMVHLAAWASAKSGVLALVNPPLKQLRDSYHVQFEKHLAEPRWDRAQREEVFELTLRTLRANAASGALWTSIEKVLNRLYDAGTCPFDTVAASYYLPPSYAGGAWSTASQATRR
jgi:type IV secretion system protein VirD4